MRPLKKDEEDWLARLIPAGHQGWERLNKFEREFFVDLEGRLRRYGRETRISPKQGETIADISEKVL